MFQAITQVFKVRQSKVKAALMLSALLCLAGSHSASAQETICAEVKIEIAQELTIERQAFEAKLKIENTLTDQSLTNINVVVEFADSDGNPVLATSDSSNTAADFFIRVNSLSGINDVEGAGVLGASQTAEATWLIIPAPGASDGIPSGKLVYVGARFEYTLDSRNDVIEVAPDSIYVKPMPLLGLDYFLPRDVFADDPLTQQVEAVEPFTLGVRVQNNGSGQGQCIKIDSAQPKIVDNEQGLAIDFRLLDSYVQDQPVSNSLLIDFGDIPAGESKMGRWIMTTSLSGRFTEFDAEYSHADELGGELTSLLENVETHFLLRDVIVDAPGRDNVKDFLAFDLFDELTNTPDEIKVFESNSTTTPVANLSSAVQFSNTPGANGGHRFQVNPQAGFLYASVEDPFAGSKVVSRALRSDGKEMNLSNVWLSKRYNRTSKQTTHYLNVFDANSTGDYTIFLDNPVLEPRPPIWQQVPYRSTVEGLTLGFVVQASDPDGTTPVLTAMNLPTGATFTDNGDGFGSFQWTPTIGQAGDYVIPLFASDGTFNESINMFVVVNAAGDSDGDGLPDQWELDRFGSLDRDGTEDFDGDGVSDLEEFENGTDPNTQNAPLAPTIVAPAFESTIDSRRPEFVIGNSQYDGPLDVIYVFEVFSDPAYSAESLVSAYYSQPEGDAGETRWPVAAQLDEDRDYFWRVRASNGFVYSPWVDGRFRVNSQNTAPSAPVISSPNNGAVVNPGSIELVVGNGVDTDGDRLSYEFFVYEDLAGATQLETSGAIAQQDMGMTKWRPTFSFTEGLTYYWRAQASDGIATPVATGIGSFTLAVTNQAPIAPTISSPALNDRVATATPTLVVVDAEDDRGANNLSYLFEVDTTEQFNSAALVESGWLNDDGVIPTFSWAVPQALTEDQTYFWRVKARDVDNAESAWVVGSFRVNAVNTVPDVPVAKNPGNGSQVITLEPKLEVHPYLDVDGDTVQYEFELSDTDNFATVLQSTVSDTSEFMLLPLGDDRIYYWRARVIDETGAQSPWSKVQQFFVNENNFDNPPAFTWLLPEGEATVGEGDTVTLRWQDEDPDSSATISLYYADNALGTNRQLIAEGISEDQDLVADTYAWSTSGLVPGDYYLFAVIDDGNSSEGVAAETVFVITIEAPASSVLLAPAAGTVFDSRTATFSWRDIGAERYQLLIGTTPGAYNIKALTFNNGETSASYNKLPFDGSKFYVTVRSFKAGVRSDSPSVEFTSVDGSVFVSELLSPIAGTTFNSRTATFTWKDIAADRYQLLIGSTPGTWNIKALTFDNGETEATFNKLPFDGSKIYVTVRTFKGGVRNDSPSVEFTALDGSVLVSELLSPIAGTVFTSRTATFKWKDIGADRYQVLIGKTPGKWDIKALTFNNGETETTYTRLPYDGSKFYVTIRTFKSGVRNDSESVEFTSVDASILSSQLLSPIAGSVLDSRTANFRWTATGADQYQVLIGKTPGKWDIKALTFNNGETEATYTRLPHDGSTFYVTIRARKWGVFKDSTPVAFTSVDSSVLTSELLSPAAQTTLDSRTATFRWAATGADQYQVLIGKTPGKWDIKALTFNNGETQTTYTRLPHDGSKFYVTIRARKWGVFKDSAPVEFTSVDSSVLTSELLSPIAQTSFDSRTATFNWKATGADQYQVLIGKTPGKWDIKVLTFNNGETQTTYNRLPHDGSKFYVTIRARKWGVFKDSAPVELTSVDSSVLTSELLSPSAGATFDSRTANFTWRDTGADQYHVLIGRTPGKWDIKVLTVAGGNTQASYARLPQDGSDVFVTIRASKWGVFKDSVPVQFISHTAVP